MPLRTWMKYPPKLYYLAGLKNQIRRIVVGYGFPIFLCFFINIDLGVGGKMLNFAAKVNIAFRKR